MTDKRPTPTPSASELRQEARSILDQLQATASRQEKRLLAVRAFELVRLAEQRMFDQQRRSQKRRNVEGT
jgi:hypothetical protein